MLMEIWNLGKLYQSFRELKIYKMNIPKIQPTDHMSTPVEYLAVPRSTSGALYQRVTICKCEKLESKLSNQIKHKMWKRNLMGVTLERNSEGPSEAKISNLQNPIILIHQKILRFQIPVWNILIKQSTCNQERSNFKVAFCLKKKKVQNLWRTPWLWQWATPLHNWYKKLWPHTKIEKY